MINFVKMERDRVDRNHGRVSTGTLVVSFDPETYRLLLSEAHKNGVTPTSKVEELVKKGLAHRNGQRVRSPEVKR